MAWHTSGINREMVLWATRKAYCRVFSCCRSQDISRWWPVWAQDPVAAGSDRTSLSSGWCAATVQGTFLVASSCSSGSHPDILSASPSSDHHTVQTAHVSQSRVWPTTFFFALHVFDVYGWVRPSIWHVCLERFGFAFSDLANARASQELLVEQQPCLQYGWSRHFGWKLRSSRACIGGEKKNRTTLQSGQDRSSNSLRVVQRTRTTGCIIVRHENTRATLVRGLTSACKVAQHSY